jgi:hypothetical protein
VYNLQFSLQLENSDTQEHDVTIWLRKNGADVAGTSGFVAVVAKHGGINGHTITSWNYLLSVVGGEYYELVWSATSTQITMPFIPAGSPPPSTASAIFTVTQQAGILAGTGITAINSLTGAVQTLANSISGTTPAFNSTGTTHTLNIPLASTASVTAGLLSNTDYTTFNGKLTPNAPITGSTKTKITYDANGLVTAGADIVPADISTSTTVGQNLIKLTNPSAISYIRIKADNTVDTRTPAQVITDLGISANIILNRNFADTSLSGTTANTVVFSILVSANTLQTNDWINFKTFVRTNTAASTITVYLNTTPTIPVSSPIVIGNLSLVANNGGLYERNWMIPSSGVSGSIKSFQGTALSAFTPANFASSTATINTTVDQYIVFAAAPASGATFITNGNITILTR